MIVGYGARRDARPSAAVEYVSIRRHRIRASRAWRINALRLLRPGTIREFIVVHHPGFSRSPVSDTDLLASVLSLRLQTTHGANVMKPGLLPEHVFRASELTTRDLP